MKSDLDAALDEVIQQEPLAATAIVDEGGALIERFYVRFGATSPIRYLLAYTFVSYGAKLANSLGITREQLYRLVDDCWPKERAKS